MPAAAALAAPDEDRSHRSDRVDGVAPAMPAGPGAGAAIRTCAAAVAADDDGNGNGSAGAEDANDDNLFSTVDIAEDEPHPEGAVARALAGETPPPDQPPPTTTAPRRRRSWRAASSAYFRKMRGGLDHPPPVPHLADLFWSFLGAFAAILAVSGLDAALWGLPPATRTYGAAAADAAGGGNIGGNISGGSNISGGGVGSGASSGYDLPHPSAHPLGALPVLVASFGASAVLLFGAPESKLSQPRGCVGGHILSAIVGVLARLALGETGARAPSYVVAALGMSLALVVMQVTRTTHPPGGATALIACTAPGVASAASWYGGRFVAAVAVGSVIMTAVGVLVNNLAEDRAYPTYWWWGTQGRPRWCGGGGRGAGKAGGGGCGGGGGVGGEGSSGGSARAP